MSPPSPIPSRYFDSEVEYSFFVTACNVFHLCASAYHTVSTLNSSSPSVSIYGARVREIFAYDSISLSADMYMLRGCNQLPSRSNISISWSVKRNNVDMKLSGNSSIHSSIFNIAPYQLMPLNTYYVYATATDLATTKSTFTYVKLVVKKGSIRAIITGSSFTTLTVGNSLILEAAKRSKIFRNAGCTCILRYREMERTEVPESPFTPASVVRMVLIWRTLVCYYSLIPRKYVVFRLNSLGLLIYNYRTVE